VELRCSLPARRAAVEEGSIAVGEAKECLGSDGADAGMSRELAASLAADVTELLALAQHLDHQLRHGAGLPDGPSVGTAPATADAAPLDDDALLDATLQALDEAERASIALCVALGRAHGLAEQLRAF
jgi:hypothetical protein